MSLAIYRRFVDKWVHPDYLPICVSSDTLDRIENRLETLLSRLYRACMEQIGPASPTLDLLSNIVEQQLAVLNVAYFLKPDEIIETTQDYRVGGLVDNFVVFAMEHSGDAYCFEVVPKSESAPEDAIVWYFNHEECECESLGILFSDWLRQYADIRKVISEFGK